LGFGISGIGVFEKKTGLMPTPAAAHHQERPARIVFDSSPLAKGSRPAQFPTVSRLNRHVCARDRRRKGSLFFYTANDAIGRSPPYAPACVGAAASFVKFLARKRIL
jgi:hypothetical protein